MINRFILAIDQGTTGSTALVVDARGAVAGRGYSEFPQHYPQPGWVEHDAMEIWHVTHRVMLEALQKAGAKPGEITAIGITNQRETAVLWERSTGRPVGRAIVWQDRRTASRCEQLRTEGAADLITGKTGLLPDPYFSGTKLEWMLDQSGMRDRADRGELAFGTIDSWLVWNLTGGKVHATDVSNASRTLLFNIHTLAWDQELLKLLHIPELVLPQVVPSSGVVGETDADSFFGHRVPIAGLAGDQQAALFGQACHTPGEAKNTYGTGSFILMHAGTQPPVSRNRMLATVAWQIGHEPVEYALEGSVFITGAAVQWLRDGLGIIQKAADTEPLARSLTSNEGVYFVPALSGLGAPHWDAGARGLLIGLTRGSTRAHIARAALESMCYQSHDVMQAMQRDTGITLQRLKVDGGAVGNGFLMQFQADILGVPVEVPEITETTALGAAFLAGLATGFWSGRGEIARVWKLARRYEPALDPHERQSLLKNWNRAIDRARGWVE